MTPSSSDDLPDAAARRGTVAAERTMRPLGLSPEAEAVYRALLRAPGISTLRLTTSLAQPQAEVAAQLMLLKGRGLVRSEGSASDAWYATAPEVAIELLLMERQGELNRARQILPDLQRDLHKGRPADTEVLRIIPGDAEAQLSEYLQMHHMAREDVATMVCPPFIASAPDAMVAAREQARRRGVRYRTLVLPELMRLPGWVESVRFAHAAGEEVRVHAALPFKMVLADRNCGLVPLHTDAPAGPALRLGPTVALEALCRLFETLWAQAAPALEAPSESDERRSPVDHELRGLVTLLAAGANDKSIAGVLGISERTLLRRIRTLSDRLDARSRFQCGWLAAKHFLGDV